MHAIELGSEIVQSLLISHLEVGYTARTKKMEFCHEISNGAANVF